MSWSCLGCSCQNLPRHASSWHVVYLLGVSLQHILLNTCVEEMQIALVKTGSHRSSWLLLCNGNQIVAQLVLLWNCSLFWGTLASLSRLSEASLSSSFCIEEIAACSLPVAVMCTVRSRTCYWGQQFSTWLLEVWHRWGVFGDVNKWPDFFFKYLHRAQGGAFPYGYQLSVEQGNTLVAWP